MSTTVSYILICCKLALSVKLTFLEVYISIIWSIGIFE